MNSFWIKNFDGVGFLQKLLLSLNRLKGHSLWCSFTNLWILLVEKTQAIISWPGLKMFVNWQPVIGLKIKLATGLPIQEPHGFRLASPNNNIQGSGAHLLSSFFLCPHCTCKPEPQMSLLLLGVVAWAGLKSADLQLLISEPWWEDRQWLRGVPLPHP